MNNVNLTSPSMLSTPPQPSKQNLSKETSGEVVSGGAAYAKRTETVSQAATSIEIGASNPYEHVSDEVWSAFYAASKGYSQLSTQSTQSLLFEDAQSVDYSTAMSLLDWSDRAGLLKSNIVIPQSSSTDISMAEKQAIADQIRRVVREQNAILENFQMLLTQQIYTIDLVA